MSQATDDAIRLLNASGYEVFRKTDRHITSTTITCDEQQVEMAKEMLMRRFPALPGVEARVEPDFSGMWPNRRTVTVGFVYYPDTMAAKPENLGVDVSEFRYGNHGSYVTRIPAYRIREPDVGQRIVFNHGPPPVRVPVAPWNPEPGQRRICSDYEGGPWYDPDDPGRAQPHVLDTDEAFVGGEITTEGRTTQLIQRRDHLAEALWAENDARLAR